MHTRSRLVALPLALLAAVASAQPQPVEPPTVTVPRLAVAPELEDFVAMSPPPHVADAMLRITGFLQRQPRDGEPASQKTDVYLGYTDDALHVVFVAHDDEPDGVRAHLRRREDIFGDDEVEIMLDTFHDKRRAYAFLTNPYGVQWDAIWTEGSGFDPSFDTVWDSHGQRTAGGFVVHMRIPFKSLRFPDQEEQTWGVILLREVRRGQGEQVFWPEVTSRIEGRLAQAATMTGLRDISPGRNLQLIPYASYRAFEILDEGAEGGPAFVSDAADTAVGLDVKTVIDDSLVLDATLNPDFSQVESDSPQVTVNQRFEVFFPERRPFFLENADVFRTPFNLLFTRRIADPRVGVRLTGKRGPYTVGALVADDEAPGKSAGPGDPLDGKAAGFAIARLARDIGAQSQIGAMFTDRELDDGHNRVFAVDGRFKLDANWVVDGQVATSDTRTTGGAELSGEAYRVGVSRSGRQLGWSAGYVDVGPDFRTDAGFVNRADIRDLNQFFSYSFRPEGDVFISWGPELFTRYVWDHDGTRLDEIWEPSLEWHWTGGTYFEANYRKANERLRTSDFPELATDTDFAVDNWFLEYGSRVLSAVTLNGSYGWGQRINFSPPAGEAPHRADWRFSNLSVDVRPLDRLVIANRWLYTRLADRSGGARILSDHIFRSRWNFQLDRRMSIRFIGQYESTAVDPTLTSVETRRNLNLDLLFTYRVNPWTAVFAGYNGNVRNVELLRDPSGRELRRTDALETKDAEQFFIKVSYLWRF